MPTLIVIPHGDASEVRYGIEKLDGGRVHELTCIQMSAMHRKVLVNDRETANFLIAQCERDEEGFFRNRTWYWRERPTAYQGGVGVRRLAGASA